MNVLKSLNSAGAVLLGHHFVYASGKHGPDFIRINALLSNEDLLGRVCEKLVQSFMDSEIDAVTACRDDRCNRLAYLAAKHLGVDAGYMESLRGKRTLVAEDILTTGGSVIDIRREAESYGALVVGASVICNRGGVTAEQLGVPRLETLVDISLAAFAPEECGLCSDGVPIVEDVGRGDSYKQVHPGYAGGYERLLVSKTPRTKAGIAN